MKLAKIIAWIGLLAMTIALFNGFINGRFQEDGSMILNNPWGVVSLVDLYVGFILFAMWMIFREKDILHAVIWVVSIMVLGFFAGALYVLVALYQSQNDWLSFFLGARKEKIIHQINSAK